MILFIFQVEIAYVKDGGKWHPKFNPAKIAYIYQKQCVLFCQQNHMILPPLIHPQSLITHTVSKLFKQRKAGSSGEKRSKQDNKKMGYLG